jgi:predicted nucleic acid-binding protein
MIAVADTSPLCYLILISEVDLLRKLFSEVVIPAAVMTELLHEDAPEAVRGWATNLPAWVSVQENPARNTAGLEKLQVGEQAAILLAESISAELILLDEKSARRIAAQHGMRITGTLGVLGEAAARGMVDLPAAIDRLRRTNFRCSPALLKATLDRFTAP